MKDLPHNHSLGLEFFRLSNLQPLSADDYFKCLNLLRSLFNDVDFMASTPGFYINRITNVDDDQGNSLRLTYYTTKSADTLKSIQDFLAKNAGIAIFASKHSNRPNPASPLDTHDDAEMRFRNFLNRNTQICLEVMENYGAHSLQELVTYYRYIALPQRIAPELIFGAVFEAHSKSFRDLKAGAREGEFWRDLVHVHAGSNYGLHFMVNMMAVPETAYHPSFWREDWIVRSTNTNTHQP